MKKNGFTLVELLSVIVLIGLLLGIGVPGVMRIRSKMQQRSLNTRINQIEQAAVLWGQDNKTRINQSTCQTSDATSCVNVSIYELVVTYDYLDGDMNSNEVKNPVTGNDLAKNTNTCKVEVYKKNNRVYAKMYESLCSDLSN